MKLEDYNENYFMMNQVRFPDRAGYTNYLEKMEQKDNWKFVIDPILDFISEDEKVLEIGGACGFFGKYARDRGVNWYVNDVSKWAYKHKVIDGKYFILSEALELLNNLRTKSYDYIVTFEFLVCFDETLIDLILEMNRVAKNQIHVINYEGAEKYYNIQDVNFWKKLPFKQKTILIDRNSIQKSNMNNPMDLIEIG